MAGHLDELKILAADFAAGESVRGAADVSYAGKVNLHQAPTGLADIGRSDAQVAAGEQLVERYGSRPEVEFPTAKQMALVVTDTRLLVWSRGGLKGKPKAFLGEIPLDLLRSVEVEEGRRLTILLTSGWEVHVDVTHDDGSGFGPVFAAAVAAADGADGADPPAAGGMQPF